MKNFVSIFILLFLSRVSFAVPLPPGAVQIRDAAGNLVTTSEVSGKQGLDVNVISSGSGSTLVNQGTPGVSPWPIFLCNSANTHCLAVNADGSINVDATVTGSVTVLNPDTNYSLETGGNLASILAKLNSSIAVTGTFFQSVQPVSGNVLVAPSPSATFPVAVVSSVPLTISNFPSPTPTQTIAGSVTVLNPDTNYSLETGGNLASILAKLNSSIAVTGTFFQSVQPVSGNVLVAPSPSATFPVAVVSSVPLTISNFPSPTPTQTIAGSVTVLNPDTNYSLETGGNLASILAKLNSSIAVTGTFFQSVQPVSGNVLVAPSPSATFPVAVVSSTINTYSACYNSLAIPTSPTDIFTLTGSATKTVTITRVQISGTETTVGMRLFSFITRSTPDSGGTCITAITGPLDQNDPAATATALGCTVSPTSLGTLFAYVGSSEFVLPATTGVDSSWPQIITWGDPGKGQGVVLRGTSQVFAVNTLVASAGSSLNICTYWTEQ